ncbi:hypothetical protein HNQ59_002500 [Chitinivorax tropicus]|uniref:Uncharacterized protein n=1 Tax=Chitinivorax tropicus TaxID=714531 RepID=A0A840MQZ5_9PROT|nr:hypothetical protein [Chitinivorax tropicus]MBB5019202.1 hypothetical protein [Chitinivorax tropicus]
MPQCKDDNNFFKYFKENMEDLGLPAPDSLFGTQSTATSTIATLLGMIDKFGKSVTVMEVIGAATSLEKLAIVGALSASYYAGAAVGSLAVATGGYMSCGTSIGDVLYETFHLGYNQPWITDHLMKHPEIYRQNMGTRYAYASRALV